MDEAEWNGRWRGDFHGTPATLSLRGEGERVAGTIDAGGYRYSIEAARVDARTARGSLVDGQGGGAVEARIELAGGGVALTLPALGGGLVLAFHPETADAGAPGRFHPVPAAASEDRDPALIGHWSRNETMISGNASLVIRHHLEISADGGYAKWTGQGSGAIRGRWRTQGGVVYSAEGAGWEPYARYFVEGGSLMLTFGDGSREVWHRG